LRKILFIAVLLPVVGAIGWWYFEESALPNYCPAYRE
jgi:predicted negative regulator of RcsB-dependent stress response